MSSPKCTAVLTILYLLLSVFGPKLMKHCPAFELRSVLVAYNSAMVALNAYICIEVRVGGQNGQICNGSLPGTWEPGPLARRRPSKASTVSCFQILVVALSAGYNFSCEPVDYSNDPWALRMAAVLWWFYISKLLEFLDTVFFILRKKFNQLTFLHVYHHSTMFCFWWIGIKWVAGGSCKYIDLSAFYGNGLTSLLAFIGALLNSFVHILMYAYYALAAAFPKSDFWWKRYLTVIQLVSANLAQLGIRRRVSSMLSFQLQFNVAIVQTIRGLRINCPFPRRMGYTLIGYMVSFIVLFGNFWFQSYTRAGKKNKKDALSDGKPALYDAVSPQVRLEFFCMYLLLKCPHFQKKHVAFANHVTVKGDSEKRKQQLAKKALREGANGIVSENGATGGKDDLRHRIK